MPVIDHFGIIAPFYERVFGASLQTDWQGELALSQGMRLLDVGGGTGRIAQHLLCESCDVIVVDESLKMLKKAREKARLHTTCSLAEDLPFGEKSFDRVIMVDAFHHVADQGRTARELFRVLKPGGVILIEEPDIRLVFVKFIALAEKLLFMRSHFLDHSEIVSLFNVFPASITVMEKDGNVWILVRRLE
ncbi:MAG: class I SAM-dependent methyltransferase [Anaerolineae bacterium]|nr:class I SAM-dependent methyltransferase [Anaerolineae bacterium]